MSFEASYLRDAGLAIPLLLYVRLLMRVSAKKKEIVGAEKTLGTITSMTRPEKARSMAMLNLHQNIIDTIYQPLRFYPVLFLLILLTDIVAYLLV